ncbi:MAG: helix-turn-helix domain-containing protein [Xenococcus sp. (in: cyanobacteria)]
MFSIINDLKREDKRAIADITLDCGFNSHSHLGKHFRRTTGVSPKKYRQER